MFSRALSGAEILSLISAAGLGGTLTSDLTLTSAGSPHTVNSTLVVPAGRTLTVQPGVTVKFAPGAGLLIDGGTLSADASAGSQILFTSTNSTPAPGAWLGVVTRTNTATTAPTATLKNVRVEYAGADASALIASGVGGQSLRAQNGSSAAFGLIIYSGSSAPGAILLDSVTVASSAGGGVSVFGGAPTLNNLTATANAGNGVSVFGGTLTMNNLTATGNTGNGLYLGTGSTTELT